MRLGEVLKIKPDRLVTLPPAASIFRAATLMEVTGVGAIVVCDPRGRVQGLLSKQDLGQAIASMGDELFELCVREVMRVDVPAATPNTPVQSVMRIMLEQRAGHMPVVEDGVAVGVVSISDLLKSRLAQEVQENAVPQDMSHARMAA